MNKQEHDKRILQAIGECDRFIDKESPRIAHLRPEKTQQHLDFCIEHKQNLINMLSD